MKQLLHYLEYSDTEPIIIGDGHKEIGKAIVNFVSEGLIKGIEYAIRQDETEFEDLFESDTLVKSMKTMAEDKNSNSNSPQKN